jgi:hypothetical protein
MKRTKAFWFVLALTVITPQAAMAQAFGEYGRVVGGATQRQGSGGLNPSGGSQRNGLSKGGSPGVGDVGGRPVPSRLIIASKEAALYPRQDDESEKIESLSQGDLLVPILQANGGNDWFMVKTQKGVIGWIKSADVRADTSKK